MTRLVYRATPIDSVRDPGLIAGARTIIDDALLESPDTIVFRPEEAFRVSLFAEISPLIEQINRDALSRADGLVAYLPSTVPTLGVGREIEAACQLGIPVLIASTRRTWSGHDCDWVDLTRGPNVIAAVVTEWANGLRGRTRAPEATRGLLVAADEGCEDLLPSRSHDGDAGFDLFVAADTFVGYNEFVDVPCGIRVALPPKTWARITGRSSTLRRRGLLVIEGVIDNGYRGPLFAGVRNMTKSGGVKLDRGDRIAQLVFHDLVADRFHPQAIDNASFDALPHDGRGAAGFGSTGV